MMRLPQCRETRILRLSWEATAEGAGRQAHDSLKAAGEMKFVAKAERVRNLTVRQGVLLQEFAGPINQSGHTKAGGRAPNKLGEFFAEALLFHVHLLRHGAYIEITGQIALQKPAGSSRPFHLGLIINAGCPREEDVGDQFLQPTNFPERRRKSCATENAQYVLESPPPLRNRLHMENRLTGIQDARRLPQVEYRAVKAKIVFMPCLSFLRSIGMREIRKHKDHIAWSQRAIIAIRVPIAACSIQKTDKRVLMKNPESAARGIAGVSSEGNLTKSRTHSIAKNHPGMRFHLRRRLMMTGDAVQNEDSPQCHFIHVFFPVCPFLDAKRVCRMAK